MCGRPGALVQLMRLTLFLVVDSAAGMGAVVAHFWNWGLSGHCADRRESAAATLSRGRPTQQLRQLGEVHPHAPRLVARQPIWSPSGATQRYVRNRGEGEARGLRLKRRA